MKTQTAPPQLGQNILVLMDDSPGFLDVLRTVVSRLPQISLKFFTLLCCCPTHYWGHGGEDSQELKLFIKETWEEEEKDFDLAEQHLVQAKSILLEAGVPSDCVLTKIATEDSLIDATVAELRRCQYSGVVVSRNHYDIVNRLLRRGITDIFRQIPKVEVWVIETDKFIKNAPI